MNTIQKNPVRNGHARSLPSKSKSWQMFDEISPKYDVLNHLLSFGIDRQWRKALLKHLSLNQSKNILDLATGTGDVLITLIQGNPAIVHATGMDLAEKMLEVGQKKIEKLGLTEKISLKKGDATKITAENDLFENITIAFGIRNVENPIDVLKEMYRVCLPGGRALILEFSLPKNGFIRAGHLFYLRMIVPLIGGLISGHYKAYKYLSQTIETFPFGERFCKMMKQCGFKKAVAHPLLFGVATIYVGEK